MIYVLDASALMAIILDERGADVVRQAGRGSEISIINVAEVMSIVAERGGDPWKVDKFIIEMGLRVRAFREGHAAEVARLRPLTKHLGLGFGDRACLAQGIASKWPILTGDHDWAKLDLGLDVRLIRDRR